MLGLRFDPARRSITLSNPSVPEFLGDVVIRNLGIGDETADVALRQSGGAISLQILRASPGMQVSLVFDRNSGIEE